MLILVVEQGPHTGQRWSIDKEAIVIGRDKKCDVPLQDPRVSRRHARLWRQGGDWLVQDLDSRNGTWVNRQRLDGPHVLQLGDKLGLGQTVFSLRWELPLHQEAVVRSANLDWPAHVLIALGALLLVVGARLPWFRVTFGIFPLPPVVIIAYGRDGLGADTFIGGVLSLALVLGMLMIKREHPAQRLPRSYLRWSALAHLFISSALLALIILDLMRYYQSANREVILGINLLKFATTWLDLKLTPQIGLIITFSGLALLLLGALVQLATVAWEKQGRWRV